MIWTGSIMDVPEPDPAGFLKELEASLGGLRRSYVFLDAMERRLFELIEGPMPASEIAGRAGIDGGLAELYCDTLESMGLLERGEDGYSNSQLASVHFSGRSPYGRDASMDRIWASVDRWQRLGEILEQGPDIIERGDLFNDRWIRGIAESCICGSVQRVASELSKEVDMGGGKRLLDLGGGHGLYSIALCAINPDLRAFVFDMPHVVPITREYIEMYQADNVDVIAGDFTKDDIGRDYDLIFTSFNSSGSDTSMIPRIRGALKEGGLLMVRQFSERMSEDPLSNLDWNLVAFEGGGERGKRRRFKSPHGSSLGEYSVALGTSGFTVLKHQPFDEMSEILIARKDCDPGG